ncbi:T9SS type A sorting domain-containing protein [Labilibacter sediminis]|nr:T9SS type A sorting domain-containing protein [Labilibacter sediminis]
MKRLFAAVFIIALMNGISAQIVNHSLNFDGGVTSKVSSGDVDALDEVSSFTIESWIYIDQWNEGASIYKKQGATWKHKIQMSLGPVASKRLYFHVSNGSNTYMAIDNSSISVGNWHHVAVAYDGNGPANDQLKAYIDGIEVTDKWFNAPGDMVATSTPVSAGAFEVGSSFDGKIDEFRVWSRTLIASEIDYTNTISQYHALYNDLILYYTADQTQNIDVADYKGNQHGVVSGNVTKVEVTGNDKFNYKIVQAYVRSEIYPRGLISDEYLLNNNDLIYFGLGPRANGDIFYSYPHNDGTLTNVNYLSSYSGRNGVLEFTGTGANANCGKGLFLDAYGGRNKFTFEAWVYIDEWVENSFIFKKGQDHFNKVDIQLGSSTNNTLYFHISNGSNKYAAVDNGISVGSWNHIAFAYNGSASAYDQVSIYINGVPVTPWYNTFEATIPTSCPDVDDDFILGENFKGKLDEIRVWNIVRTESNVIANMNNEIASSWWGFGQMSAYWKVNDASNPAGDSKSLLSDFEDFKSIFEGRQGANLRLGFFTGNYKEMIKTEASRRNFAHNVKNLMDEFGADGVDIDFEWNYSPQEWADYNTTIEAINDSLPASSIFSASLHSYFYKLTSAAINALDLINIQIYGPQLELFPYSKFVSDYDKVINYGIPANKLIMGVPFYGQSTNGHEVTYDNILNAYPNLEANVDTVQMTVSGELVDVIFNGVNTIKQKAEFVKNNARGFMYWDTYTDVDYSNEKCLLRATNSEINANVPSLVTLLKSASIATPEDFKYEEEVSLKLYPNPSSDIVTVNAGEAIESITICNMAGNQVLFQQNYNEENSVRINVSNLSQGVYLVQVKLSSQGKLQTLKLVIRR